MSRARMIVSEDTTPRTLRDYVVLADGNRGAMLSPDGGVAWLCFPSWSDPAVFAGLLGSGGAYAVTPVDRHVHGGYYESGTLIWRQRWVTLDGLIETREVLAYPGRSTSALLLRRITAVDGVVPMTMRLQLGADYGRAVSTTWRKAGDAWLSDVKGVHCRWTCSPATGRAPRPRQGQLVMDFAMQPGEAVDLALELSSSRLDDADPIDLEEAWQRTERAWSSAVPGCDSLPARRDVRHSFAVLRGLTTGSGATVAAATTALPERAEAGRNYDYRYAWIRDICYIGQAGAAVDGGEQLLDDAVRWVCTRMLADGEHTKPAYCVDGNPIPEPRHLGLEGYPGGSDVVGNRVTSQFQLDLFGETLLLLAKAASKDRLDGDGWETARVAIRAIENRHEEKEAGIWEVEPNLWTHSRLICVAGLRAIAGQGASQPWSNTALSLADRLLSEADRTSLHPSGRWQRAPNDSRVDASLLLSEVRGAVASSDPRSVATRQAVLEDICEDDYLYRYAEHGETLGENEGAFLICNFWMGLACLKAGRVTEGAQWFERTRASCSTSGLFSEEYDVAQRQLRGNLPQAFVHALLIECAAELQRA
jgi:GH15 family glucan-1,4-alpha-glucosidase